MKQICEIFRSSRDSDMYLYVLKQEGLARVPEALLEKFGTPRHAMTLLLTPERKLARADAGKVMAQLNEQGYYLQLPPPKDASMQAINQHNSKLGL